MTLDQILSAVNYYAGKDTRGRTMKITEFNILLPSVQESYYASELKPVIDDNSPIWKFITHMGSDSTTMPLTVSATGVALVPADYVKWIDMTFIYDGTERQVEVLDGFEFDNRKSHATEVPTRKYPIATFGGTTIRVAPKNMQYLNFTYFRKPTVPYYDYCQDAATLNEVYMPVGSYVDQGSPGEEDLYNSLGVVIATNVTKPYSPITGKTSQTVELEWEDRYHPQFVLRLGAMVGVNIQMADLTQYMEAKQNA
jgi:hypothetical protein